MKLYYALFNLVCDTIKLGGFLDKNFNFFLALEYFVNVLGHDLLQAAQLFH